MHQTAATEKSTWECETTFECPRQRISSKSRRKIAYLDLCLRLRLRLCVGMLWNEREPACIVGRSVFCEIGQNPNGSAKKAINNSVASSSYSRCQQTVFFESLFHWLLGRQMKEKTPFNLCWCHIIISTRDDDSKKVHLAGHRPPTDPPLHRIRY